MPSPEQMTSRRDRSGFFRGTAGPLAVHSRSRGMRLAGSTPANRTPPWPSLSKVEVRTGKAMNFSGVSSMPSGIRTVTFFPAYLKRAPAAGRARSRRATQSVFILSMPDFILLTAGLAGEDSSFMSRRAHLHLFAFVLLATGIYAAEVAVVRMRWPWPDLIAIGVMLDLIVMVPAVYWFLAVRRGGWPRLSVVPVVLLGILGSALLMPQDRGLLREVVGVLAIPYEIGLVTWIAVRTRRALRRTPGDGDTLERFREVAREVLPARRAADAVAFEMAVLYYALLSWRRRPEDLDGAFTNHRKSGYGAFVFAVLIMVLAEAIPVHILLMRWSVVAAWALTILSLYAVVFFLADWRAARFHPILLDGEALRIRVGLRWRIRVPREQIAAVHKKRPPGSDPYIRAALPGPNPLWIELTEPVIAEGPY